MFGQRYEFENSVELAALVGAVQRRDDDRLAQVGQVLGELNHVAEKLPLIQTDH